MAKIKSTPYKKADPIFSAGSQFFRPVSIKLTKDLPKNTVGEVQQEKQKQEKKKPW